MKIFLSGPLFTAAEREFNRRLATLLEAAGYQVWLPQENKTTPRAAAPIFRSIVKRLREADVVVANMDGADPDSGASWECGYAYASGTPVIAFRTDVRKERNAKLGPYNLMMWTSATERMDGPFATVEDVAERLRPLLAKGRLERKQSLRRVNAARGRERRP